MRECGAAAGGGRGTATGGLWRRDAAPHRPDARRDNALLGNRRLLYYATSFLVTLRSCCNDRSTSPVVNNNYLLFITHLKNNLYVYYGIYVCLFNNCKGVHSPLLIEGVN